MAMSEGWLDALGKPVPGSNFIKCYEFVTEDCDLPGDEAVFVLELVCHEIAKDQPERAQKYMRSWMMDHQTYNAETSVLRALAILVS